MIGAKASGNFDNFFSFAKRAKNREIFDGLEDFGRRGVEALASATPVDTGISANSWSYRIFRKGRRIHIEWFNNHFDDEGTPIVVLVQYGHGTGTGGYVQGYDFINPVMQPIFDDIEAYIWKAVRS